MVATLMDLAERPSAATGLHPGGVQIPPRRRKRRDGDPRRPISPTTAVFWLARPDARGVRLLTDLRGSAASMAAPDAQRGQRVAGGVLPAFSRSRWSLKQRVSSRLRATGLSAAYCCEAAGGLPFVLGCSASVRSNSPPYDVKAAPRRSQPSAQAPAFGGGLRGVDHMQTLRSLRFSTNPQGASPPSPHPTPLYRRPSFVWIFG